MNPLKVSFKPQALPKMLADLSHSNQFLKVFAAGALALSLLLVILLSVVLSRGPLVIALASDAKPFKEISTPSPELEVREALKAYLAVRYNWDKDSVDGNLNLAKLFVASQFSSQFDQGVSNVRKFAKDKAVSQRAYATGVAVDLKRQVALISGDRISEIQGIKAAGALSIELAFQSGPRTKVNPWGIYIVKETEK